MKSDYTHYKGYVIFKQTRRCWDAYLPVIDGAPTVCAEWVSLANPTKRAARAAIESHIRRQQRAAAIAE